MQYIWHHQSILINIYCSPIYIAQYILLTHRYSNTHCNMYSNTYCNGRVAKIIVKHWKFICLLRKCYPNCKTIINELTLVRRVVRTIAKHKKIICLLRNVSHTNGIVINEWKLVWRVTRIIKKYKEFICLLRACYYTYRKSNKYVNDNGAQRDSHSQT